MTRGVVRCSGTHAYYTVGVVSGLLVVAVRGSSLSLWVAEGRGMINHVRLYVVGYRRSVAFLWFWDTPYVWKVS